MINFLKKYYLIVVILFAVIGGLCIYNSNDFDIKSINVQQITNNNVVTTTINKIESKKYYFEIAGYVFINFSITLMITMFFIQFIEKEDKLKFESKILEYQKNTANDAILSVFNRLIEPEFFNILKDELLNSTFIRKNAVWQYDIIIEEDNNLKLTRTISYHLYNQSNQEANEKISLTYADNSHAKSKILNVKIKSGNDSNFSELAVPSENTELGFKNKELDVKIPANSSIEVLTELVQNFTSNYIYETHFTKYPIINLDLIINFPKDYCFNISSAMSSSLRLIVDNETKKYYKIQGAIYKGQGIEFICEKKFIC